MRREEPMFACLLEVCPSLPERLGDRALLGENMVYMGQRRLKCSQSLLPAGRSKKHAKSTDRVTTNQGRREAQRTGWGPGQKKSATQRIMHDGRLGRGSRETVVE